MVYIYFINYKSLNKLWKMPKQSVKSFPIWDRRKFWFILWNWTRWDYAASDLTEGKIPSGFFPMMKFRYPIPDAVMSLLRYCWGHSFPIRIFRKPFPKQLLLRKNASKPLIIIIPIPNTDFYSKTDSALFWQTKREFMKQSEFSDSLIYK